MLAGFSWQGLAGHHYENYNHRDDDFDFDDFLRQRSSSLPPGQSEAQLKRIEEENGAKKSKIAEEVRQ